MKNKSTDNFYMQFQHYALLAGVDEVGRGPLAGDVVAAAVILDPDNPIMRVLYPNLSIISFPQE